MMVGGVIHVIAPRTQSDLRRLVYASIRRKGEFTFCTTEAQLPATTMQFHAEVSRNQRGKWSCHAKAIEKCYPCTTQRTIGCKIMKSYWFSTSGTPGHYPR